MAQIGHITNSGHPTVSVMIDWVSAKVPLRHSETLDDGRSIQIDADGAVKFDSPLWKSIAGSYSSSLQIKTCETDHEGNGSHISISGNPVKWIQGHNIFGTDDLCGLVNETMFRICSILKISPTLDDIQAWRQGDFSLSRIDINGMYALGSRSNVNAWINAAAATARTRMGVGIINGGTCYWGKHSSRWALKCYSKGEEIRKKGHQLPPELSLTRLAEYADDKLRLELVLRQKELKKLGLATGSAWENVEVMGIYDFYREKLQTSEQKLADKSILSLPSCVRGTYQLWSDGHDYRQILSQRTYYRHRRQLLRHGIDISVPKTNSSGNVVPLIRVLEAVPDGVPDWAEGTNLLFEPHKRRKLELVSSNEIDEPKVKSL